MPVEIKIKVLIGKRLIINYSAQISQNYFVFTQIIVKNKTKNIFEQCSYVIILWYIKSIIYYI